MSGSTLSETRRQLQSKLSFKSQLSFKTQLSFMSKLSSPLWEPVLQCAAHITALRWCAAVMDVLAEEKVVGQVTVAMVTGAIHANDIMTTGFLPMEQSSC